MRKALFLDRDGVVNVETNYLYRIEDFEFIGGVFDTCRYFQSLGYLLIIVTNQAGIARGLYTEEDYQKITAWMVKQFFEASIKIDGVYHCPHHPEFSGQCSCRKPLPGMLLQAAGEHNIDLASSAMVGDKRSDMEAALAAGIACRFLVRSGHKIDVADERLSITVIDSMQALPIVWLELKNRCKLKN